MGLKLRHSSRWLNGVLLADATAEDYEQVLELSFTAIHPWHPDPAERYYPEITTVSRFEPAISGGAHFDYGVAREQVEQVNTHYLHQKGFTGKGVWIGVLDAGFRNVDTLSSFTPLFHERRLLATRNFVCDSSVFRLINSHGMHVLSIMGGLKNSAIVGTAPHASYILCSTENVHSETRTEEAAWIEAAEYLDSLGVDVFNTSLGYSTFDSVKYNYSYSDMDGESTLISRASSMLASKGIISSTSAGNEGNNSWYRITAPSDARDILCVGAVDSTGNLAGFSSRGPSYDGRIKPEITAMGRATGIQYVNGGLARGSGTSFSSPVVAGSVASLWQAWPQTSAADLIRLIRNTGGHFQHPDASYGYGIPSFAWVYNQISSVPVYSRDAELTLYPQPASVWVHVGLPGNRAGVFPLRIYDSGGRVRLDGQMELPGRLSLPSDLGPGLYIVEIREEGRSFRNKLLIR